LSQHRRRSDARARAHVADQAARRPDRRSMSAANASKSQAVRAPQRQRRLRSRHDVGGPLVPPGLASLPLEPPTQAGPAHRSRRRRRAPDIRYQTSPPGGGRPRFPTGQVPAAWSPSGAAFNSQGVDTKAAPIGQQRCRAGAGRRSNLRSRPDRERAIGTKLRMNIRLDDLDLEGQLLQDVVEELDGRLLVGPVVWELQIQEPPEPVKMPGVVRIPSQQLHTAVITTTSLMLIFIHDSCWLQRACPKVAEEPVPKQLALQLPLASPA
jgi:hypothetical protein